MTARRSTSLALRGALLTVATLGGGLVLAFPVTGGVTTAVTRAGLPLGPWIFLGILLLCGGGAGALWAAGLGALLGTERLRRTAIAGAIGFGASSALAVRALTTIETRLLAQAQTGDVTPMHVAFIVTFPGAAVLVVLLSVAALGLGLGLRGRALAVALASGLVAGTAFLVVALLFDAAGWRVGAPGAEARFTMVVVMAVGALVTLLAGGAASAALLGRAAAATPRRSATGAPVRRSA
jgi:hypothetical protein